MQRIAFKMQVFPGREAEYRKRHDEIWPELAELLAAYGIRDYSIFHDSDTNILFAVHKATPTNRLSELFAEPLMQKWFVHMSDIMQTNSDKTPVQIPLVEVFHMD